MSEVRRKKRPSDRRREHLRALRRRHDHLTDRVANYHPEGNPSYDLAELSALSWCLGIIEAVLDDEPVEVD